MVLAERMKLDISKQDHFVIALTEDRFQVDSRILAQTGHELGISAGYSIGSANQSFAIRIFANRKENLAHRALDARQVDISVLNRFPVAGILDTGKSCRVGMFSIALGHSLAPDLGDFAAEL